MCVYVCVCVCVCVFVFVLVNSTVVNIVKDMSSVTSYVGLQIHAIGHMRTYNTYIHTVH